MNSVRGWRDPRTGRVSGFQSEAQRENFMAARARFSDGPNRLMPRCSATNRLGEPCRAARMRGRSTCFRHGGGAGETGSVGGGASCLEIWTTSNAPRCDQNATGCASSGAAIRASPAGRLCWSPTTRRPAEHGQRGKASSSISSTATSRRSPMRAGGYGRGCRAV